MKIAVVGGTGDFGLALAQRLAEVGEDVVIGSRERVASGSRVPPGGRVPSG